MYFSSVIEIRFFFYLNLFICSNSEVFCNHNPFLIMPFDRLLGDNRYRESPYNMSHVQELLLGEAIKGSDLTVMERNLLCDPQALDSCSRLLGSLLLHSCQALDSSSSRLSELLRSRILWLPTSRVALLLTPPALYSSWIPCIEFHSYHMSPLPPRAVRQKGVDISNVMDSILIDFTTPSP